MENTDPTVKIWKTVLVEDVAGLYNSRKKCGFAMNSEFRYKTRQALLSWLIES
jgi:hypothetical protein